MPFVGRHQSIAELIMYENVSITVDNGGNGDDNDGGDGEHGDDAEPAAKNQGDSG